MGLGVAEMTCRWQVDLEAHVELRRKQGGILVSYNGLLKLLKEAGHYISVYADDLVIIAQGKFKTMVKNVYRKDSMERS